MRFNVNKLLKDNKNIRKFAAGDIIIREGAPMGNQMYIVLWGTVGIYKQYDTERPVQVAEIGPDSVLGEMSLFLNHSPTATAVAQGEVYALELTRDNAYLFFEKEPEATYMLVKILCERIEALTSRYADAVPPPVEPPIPPKTAPVQPAASKEPVQPPVQAVPETKPATQPVPALSSDLFPPGHKLYTLPEAAIDQSLLSTSKYTCTMCQHNFEAPHVRFVKVRLLGTDPDLRKHYEGVEPMHYLTLTCPRCYFSALRTQFNKTVSFNRKALQDALLKLRQEINVVFPAQPDAQSVFASMYLTLACTPFCSRKEASASGYLWLNISWLYRDCGDEEMEKLAMTMASDAYEKAYSQVRMEKDVEQQVCLILGQLKAKLGDIASARRFLFEAKTNKFGSRALAMMAEDVIESIRKQNEAG